MKLLPRKYLNALLTALMCCGTVGALAQHSCPDTTERYRLFFGGDSAGWAYKNYVLRDGSFLLVQQLQPGAGVAANPVIHHYNSNRQVVWSDYLHPLTADSSFAVLNATDAPDGRLFLLSMVSDAGFTGISGQLLLTILNPDGNLVQNQRIQLPPSAAVAGGFTSCYLQCTDNNILFVLINYNSALLTSSLFLTKLDPGSSTFLWSGKDRKSSNQILRELEQFGKIQAVLG